MAPLLGGHEEAGGAGEGVPRVGGVGERVPRMGGVGERVPRVGGVGERVPRVGGVGERVPRVGGVGEGVPRVGGVGEEAAPRGTGDFGALTGANGLPSAPCPNGLPVLGSTLTTWGPVGCVTPSVIVTMLLVGLVARSRSIMRESPAERPTGPDGYPAAAPAAAPAPCACVGEAAVALSDDDPVVVVGAVAGVVLGVTVTAEGEDLVDVVGGEVVRPSEVCCSPGLCIALALMSMALPLPRPSPGGPFPPGGTEDILNFFGADLFPNPDCQAPSRRPTLPSP